VKNVDLWMPRSASHDFDEDELNDSFVSCDEDDSDNEVWFTPPQSPSQMVDNSDDEMNDFEESLEHFEDEKAYLLFING
jgi:hypothetical protein